MWIVVPVPLPIASVICSYSEVMVYAGVSGEGFYFAKVKRLCLSLPCYCRRGGYDF